MFSLLNLQFEPALKMGKVAIKGGKLAALHYSGGSGERNYPLHCCPFHPVAKGDMREHSHAMSGQGYSIASNL